jgi:sugar phosphate isomerase/epimerase
MSTRLTRRDLVMAGAAAVVAAAAPAAPAADPKQPFGYCLNTATIRGQNLSVPEQIDVAGKAGYQGLEPWIGDLEKYVAGGGDLKNLAKRLRDYGLTVESAIGFAEWIVDDDARRRKGLEQARRDMDLVAKIGGKRLAAPPAGAVDQANLNLLQAAERYAALAKIGADLGVTPQVEVWGFSKSLSRVGEAAQVALESGRPEACLLLDVYHLHKGGSGFGCVNLLGPKAFGVFHVNDYPAKPDRAALTDAQRVYPGDGVAPLTKFFRDLHALGFRGMLSLEVFNPGYWKQDALVVARTGLEKLRAVVAKSLAAP